MWANIAIVQNSAAAMRRSIHTRRVRQPTPPTSTAVSSRGCSKTYIICFLARILEHCRSLEHAPDFPFPSELVTKWLMTARQDCINKAIDAEFGGVKFNEEDPSSYWTSVSQFFTWWKNNIERRKKFRLLKVWKFICKTKYILTAAVSHRWTPLTVEMK